MLRHAHIFECLWTPSVPQKFFVQPLFWTDKTHQIPSQNPITTPWKTSIQKTMVWHHEKAQEKAPFTHTHTPWKIPLFIILLPPLLPLLPQAAKPQRPRPQGRPRPPSRSKVRSTSLRSAANRWSPDWIKRCLGKPTGNLGWNPDKNKRSNEYQCNLLNRNYWLTFLIR